MPSKTGFFGDCGINLLDGNGIFLALTPVNTVLKTSITKTAMTGVQFDVLQTGNIKAALFGGEGGLFFALLQGHGKVWLQSLPFSRLAGRMLRAAPQRGGGIWRKAQFWEAWGT